MVAMAQSAANWHDTYTRMDHSHSLTHLQLYQHSYNHVVRSASLRGYYFSVHAGSFHVSVIYQTLTWTTGSLLCVRHSCVCIYTQGFGTLTASQHILNGKTDNFCVCSWRDSNLGPLDLGSDALPIEPPCHPYPVTHNTIGFGHGRFACQLYNTIQTTLLSPWGNSLGSNKTWN